MIRLQKEGLLVQTFRNLILSGEFKEARGWHSEALRILDWNFFFESDIQPTDEKSRSPRKCKWNCQRQGAEDGGEDLFFPILVMDFEWFYDLFFWSSPFEDVAGIFMVVVGSLPFA